MYIISIHINIYTYIYTHTYSDFSTPAAEGKCAEGDLILATACDDKVVRIFNVALDASHAALLVELVGHSEKAFNVRHDIHTYVYIHK